MNLLRYILNRLAYLMNVGLHFFSFNLIHGLGKLHQCSKSKKYLAEVE